jgi:hypothetical protein
MNHEELRQTFDSLLQSSISPVQLSRLVNRAIRIASGILRARFSRYLVILYDAGYTAESAAARCIENLFLPRQDVPCARLTEYLRDQLGSDAALFNGDCERLLQRCVYFNVQRGIPDMLGEFDPQYGKILRLVQDALSKDSPYRKQRGFFEDMVARGTDEELRLEQPAMPPDAIVAQLSRRASPDDSTTALIGHVFDILDEEPRVRRIIAVSQLVTVLRDFFNLYWKFDRADEEEGAEELFDQGDIERITEPVVRELTAGVFASYLRRGVLADAEIGHLTSAVRALLYDLASGTTVPWFEYHEREFPDISYDEYRDEHRARFEYVLGSAKELFLLRCRKYFRADFSAADL